MDSSDAGKALAKKGASKGGRARASVMTPEERKDVARRGAAARWAKAGKVVREEETAVAVVVPAATDRPYSMFSGTLTMGDVEIECHVLSDLRRVFTQREVVRVLSGGRSSGSYMRNIPGFDPEALAARVIVFNVPAGPPRNFGYEATLLVDICEAYLDARDAGTLAANQAGIAQMAQVIVRACARVGITALVDEATGYQEVREKHALQAKLRAFIADQMGEWVKRFPDEFWLELARLEGVRYSPRNRPIRWGKYVMDFVYDAMDPDVGRRLREINPGPARGHNHHQWLQDFGQKELNNHLQRVVAVMKMCNDMGEFRRKFPRVFGPGPLQLEIAGVEWG
jgi:hypothetical protein